MSEVVKIVDRDGDFVEMFPQLSDSVILRVSMPATDCTSEHVAAMHLTRKDAKRLRKALKAAFPKVQS